MLSRVSYLIKAKGRRHLSSLSFAAWMEEKVLQRQNPFLQHVEVLQEQQEQKEQSESSPSTSKTAEGGTLHRQLTRLRLPPWDKYQPHHAKKATSAVLETFSKDLQSLASNTPSSSSITDLQEAWNQVQQPVVFVQQSLSVLALAADPPSVQVQWQMANEAFLREYASMWQENVIDANDGLASLFGKASMDTASSASLSSPSASSSCSSPQQQQRWLQYWQEQTGATLLNNRHDEWRRWQLALSEIRQAWPQIKPQQSRSWLPLLYSYIGSRQALSRNVWHCENAAAHSLQLRFAQDESQIVALHEAVRERVIPHVMTASSLMEEQQQRDPRIKQLLKQRTIALDAALLVLEQVCRDVFGVTTTWSRDAATTGKTWHSDVRMLHLSKLHTNKGNHVDHDNNQSTTYLGSVYFDFFARPGKAKASATVPLVNSLTTTIPSVRVVSLQFEAPVWDTDPVHLSWENLLDLFHEVGHVLQLANPDPTWPADWAEVLPKVRMFCVCFEYLLLVLDMAMVGCCSIDECHDGSYLTNTLPSQFMEHFLWDPATMKSLLTASGVDFQDETIDVLYRQASRAKANELAHQAFYSATEWELLSTYEIEKGDETVMALAQRLARDYIPHDVPHPTDFFALYQVANANIMDGESVALYRYLWAEAVAANIFEKVKESYENKHRVPMDAMRQHVCQPTDWQSLSNAFDIPQDEIAVDAMWNRYNLVE